MSLSSGHSMTGDPCSVILKDFSFCFEGDDRFTKERIGHMKSLINRQIDAVLSKEVLYTKNVFVPELHLEKQKRGRGAQKAGGSLSGVGRSSGQGWFPDQCLRR